MKTGTGTRPATTPEKFSAYSLKPGLRAVLQERPEGLREPLLIALCAADSYPRPLPAYAAAVSSSVNSTAARKTRSALRSIGAKLDRQTLRWSLAPPATDGHEGDG